jgi:Asp-tRNA(Asn)/Glu-tRNA(Gln) amidotransferase B subunit
VQDWNAKVISPETLARILQLLLSGKVTTDSARLILKQAYLGDVSDPAEIAEAQGLIVSELAADEYHAVLDRLLETNQDMVTAIQTRGQKGKVSWFVGQALKEFGRAGNAGAVRPEKLRELLTEKLGLKE